MAEAPAPKKRRTDNGPPTAGGIAEANSTAHLFVGQRQNRWMSGLAALGINIEEQHLSTLGSSGVGRERSGSNAAGTTLRYPSLDHSHLVNYESPSRGPNPNGAIAGQRNSFGQIATAETQASLPSPALTDRHIRTPSNSSTGHPLMEMAHPPPQARQSQDGSSMRSPNTSALNVPPPRARPTASEALSRSRPPNQHLRTASNSSTAHTPVEMAHLRSQSGQQQSSEFSLQPVQDFVANHQNTATQESVVSMNAMRPKLVAFWKHMDQIYHAPTNRVNSDTQGFGRGRLMLLEQALDSSDWFYIVLNQINALWSLPKDSKTPDVIWKVDMRAQSYLDKLLCPNNTLYPPVLKWLSEFPAPIQAIFASENWKSYESFVKKVIDFCNRLPKQWDSIEEACKKAHAPPLTEDLDERLKLKSSVLIATAFRSITRSIYGDTSITPLETLHRLDQEYFRVKGRRISDDQKHAAYNAYRVTIRQWRLYERMCNQEHARRQSQPQVHYPTLKDFEVPLEATAVFQLTNPVTPVEQTTVMMVNGQNLRQSRPAHLATVPPQQLVYGPNGLVPRPVQQTHPGSGYMFPREGAEPRAQPTQPDTTKSALHQAHLRSPIIGPMQPALEAPRLFRHVIGYALPPAKLQKTLPIQTVHFDIPQEEVDKIPLTVAQERLGEQPVRTLNEKSRTYRLRCAAMPPEGFPTDSAWAVADNIWPDDLYLELNDAMLEPRRKLHHARYLPIDLTCIIKPGINTLTAIISRASTDPRPFEFALAIEIVGVTSHESIKNHITVISAADSLCEIKKSLAGGENDDEVSITTSNLMIQLFDPYSNSKMFDIPVRGLQCKHKACFDLETFLGVCKRERAWWPTVVDCWRCPICRGDVRPQMLVIDGFLVQMRDEMAEKGILDTRAVIVNADGSWQPKKEETTGVRSASLDREEAASMSKKMPEIIEID